MKLVTRHIPIYYGIFRIVITKNFDKGLKKIGKDFGQSMKGYGAFVYPDKKKNGVNRYTVFVKPNCSNSVIAHEAVHLVNALYIDSGITLDPHNDEPQAYLTGWFVKKIDKALKRK